MNYEIYIEESYKEDYTMQSKWNGTVPEDIMMKILICGYMNDSFSSRKIEQLCRRDIHFKPANYEQSKKRNYRTIYGRPENMEYHEMGDIFICKAGKILWRTGTKHEKTKSGYVSEKAMYRCENCEGCQFKQSCTKAKGNKTLAVSHKFKELRAESQKNITTKFGKQLRMNRSIQAEGVFGVLKEDHGFRRFLCRGKNNIKTEFLLLGLAYNIKKLFTKISENRLGISLFEFKTHYPQLKRKTRRKPRVKFSVKPFSKGLRFPKAEPLVVRRSGRNSLRRQKRRKGFRKTLAGGFPECEAQFLLGNRRSIVVIPVPAARRRRL